MRERSPSTFPEQGNRASPYSRYLLWLFVVPLVGYLLVFPLVRFPALGFDRWGGSKWAPVLDYSYHVPTDDADIVIFGDSSAFLGIDPRLVDRELGVHTVVLPNTVGSLQVTGDLALRHYLATHSAPRAIVFFFTPWNLNFRHASRPEFLFEGEEMLIRNGSLGQIAHFAMVHPKTFLAFPLQLVALLDLHDLRLALTTDRRKMAITGQGHMDYSDPIGHMPTPCTLPESELRQPDAASLAPLLQQYTTSQTQVYLYLSPVPSCSNAAPITHARQVPGMIAVPPHTLPPSWFAADGMDAHILPAYVAKDTELFIDALRSWKVGEKI